MRFYDNKRKEHDTRIGALCGSIFNTVGGFLEDKIPGLNVFDEMPDDIVDGEYEDITEENESSFFDPEEDDTSEEHQDDTEDIKLYDPRFKFNAIDNCIEILDDSHHDVIGSVSIAGAISQGFVTDDLRKYMTNIRSKESIDSLKECLDNIATLRNV